MLLFRSEHNRQIKRAAKSFGPFSWKGTVYNDRAFRERSTAAGAQIHPMNSPQKKEGKWQNPMIQKTEKEYSSYITLQDYAEDLHPEPRVSPQAKCNVLWYLLCNFMTILLAYFSFQDNMMVGSILQLHNVIWEGHAGGQAWKWSCNAFKSSPRERLKARNVRVILPILNLR